MKVFIFLTAQIFSLALFAAEELAPVEQREPAAVHLVVDQAKLRQYAGGRDEQDIKIQPSLPQPTKNIDGSPTGEMTVPDDHDD